MSPWNLHQNQLNASAHREAGRASNKANRAEAKVDDIHKQLNHLTLLCQSMWELLRDESGLTDNQLRAKIADVDTRDGKPDGKINATVFPCPACGANCNTSRQHCTMCGEDLSKHKPHLFEA